MLERAGYRVTSERVDTREAMAEAIEMITPSFMKCQMVCSVSIKALPPAA